MPSIDLPDHNHCLSAFLDDYVKDQTFTPLTGPWYVVSHVHRAGLKESGLQPTLLLFLTSYAVLGMQGRQAIASALMPVESASVSWHMFCIIDIRDVREILHRSISYSALQACKGGYFPRSPSKTSCCHI